MIKISVDTTSFPHANNLDWAWGKWENLYKITENFEYSACYFPSKKRNNLSAKGVSSIILDFDEETSLKDGIETFRDVKSLIITTKSHQVEKNGIVSDRFRAILPLNFTIIDMAYYSKLMRVITRYYNSDIACTDPARYYSPNKKQLVYYSNSNKYFDIKKFDSKIESNGEIVPASTVSSYKKYSKSTKVQKRIDLDLNSEIIYYLNGIRATNTLKYIITNIKTNNKALSCHCFLNPKHEDKNPSCFIYLNQNNIYIKCVSCGIDGLFFKVER